LRFRPLDRPSAWQPSPTAPDRGAGVSPRGPQPQNNRPSNYNGGSYNGGYSGGGYSGGGYPVVLNLDGKGVKVMPLSSSNQFFAMTNDDYQHRTVQGAKVPAGAQSAPRKAPRRQDPDHSIGRSLLFRRS
jgi:hypothetical protein